MDMSGPAQLYQIQVIDRNGATHTRTSETPPLLVDIHSFVDRMKTEVEVKRVQVVIQTRTVMVIG